MPPNISGTYMSSVAEKKNKNLCWDDIISYGSMSKQQTTWDRPIFFIKYLLCHYLGKQLFICGPFLVETDTGSTGEWAEPFSSITVTENSLLD